MGGRTTRKQVALYLDDEQVQALADLAARTNRTQQQVLRQALEAELARHRNPKAKPKP